MFDSHFEVLLADTTESKQWHYRLRYQVYCQETGFEDPAAYPDKMERDSYDDISAHFLVRARMTGEWVGAMRLVFGRITELPLTNYSMLDNKFLGHPQQLYAEISRLCVIGKYRRHKALRPGQGQQAATERKTSRHIVNLQDQRREPEILLGLLRAGHAYVRQRGIEQGFFFVSEPLARIIKRIPLHIEPAGPLSEHRGMRRPYHWDIAKVARNLAKQSPHIARMYLRSPAYRLCSEAEDLALPLAANQA